MAKKKEKASIKEDLNFRPPIVTLMGHVDHGKTSILDAIRKSNLQRKETGGITQHIGAYNVEKDGKKITFIDTPGHEAFSQMRARGGSASDVVVLVVAADDGVMPQTKEAIMHAKAAGVPIIVAINKCDLVTADINKVKRGLAESDVAVEGFGGDVVAVEVSAKENTGIDKLLDVILLISEMKMDELTTDPNGMLEALIIESRQDSKRGIVVSAIIKNGTLSIRDEIVAGKSDGRVRSITDSYAKSKKQVFPGEAVEILGFSSNPEVGDVITRKGEIRDKDENEDKAKETTLTSADVLASGSQESPAEGEASKEAEPVKKVLNLIIRADTVGTAEAIVSSVKKLQVEDAIPNILLAGPGDVKEADVLLASSASAVIMTFKVKISDSVLELAKSHKVLVREHEIIYSLVEEVEDALQGVLEIEEAKVKGRGIVIKIFTLPKSDMKVAGTLIEAGKFRINARIGIFREDKETPIFVSRIRSIHVGSNEVQEAKKGDECGILLKPQIAEIQLDDQIEIL